jgi:hypothetical protein
MGTFNPKELNTVVASLHLVADHLHELPDEVVESQLVTYDMFIGLSEAPCRQQAGALLREAATRCTDLERRNRLVQAAESVEKGEPCAVTEQGLTAKQAAEASTITEAEWRQEGNREQSGAVVAKADPHAPSPTEPRSLPHLSLWDMFPGLTVRIGKTFNDYDGEEHKAGEILHFRHRDYFAKEGGFTLTFAEKEIRLCDLVPENAPMIENEGNIYFEPVADLETLRACWQLIHQQWNWIDKSHVEHAAEIGAELDACGRWLKNKTQLAPAPVCVTPLLTPEDFADAPRGTTATSLSFRINFLFAGIRSLS